MDELSGLSEDQQILVLRKEAKIKELCAKHDIEIDQSMEDILQFILKGYFVKGAEALITRDWIINMELSLFASSQRDSTRQRIIEHLSSLMGYMPESGSKADIFVDATVGTLNES